MAQVIKNADDTFVVTLTAKEQKTLQRWSNEPRTGGPVSKAKQLEMVIDSDLAQKASEYLAIDGPTLRQKYEAATPAVQAQVDALLP